MTSCESSLSMLCCRTTVLSALREVILIDGQADRISINAALLEQYINCAKEKFESIVGDIPEELRAQIVKIIDTSSSATQQIFYIAFGSIAITIFLVTLIIFAAIYWRDTNYVIPLTFFLALLVIIAAAVIAYVWITNIYNEASTIVDTNLNNINQVINLIQIGLPAAFCCFGGFNCGPGTPCSCSRECILTN